ncbi:MAG TPA: hypothetical protein VGB25_08095 [Candidatus Binatia bacterium]
MRQPRDPRKASTVILVRPHAEGKFEVFMTRRPMEMKFLGGFYVFPGGSIGEEDHSQAVLKRCRGLSPDEARSILGNELSPEMALAHWVAAIRELFEEAGVLLCVTEAGHPLDMEQRKVRERLAEKRLALVEGSLDFLTLLKTEGLYCDAGRAVFFYHRITPEVYSTRFDTRFYLARLPAGQTPLARSEEVIDGRWITPERALESCHSGDFPIIPPTTTSLQTLAGFDSWQSLCAEYRLH